MLRLSPFDMALRACSFRRELRAELYDCGLTPLDEDDARPFLIDVRVPFTAEQIHRPSPNPFNKGRDLAAAVEAAFLTAQVRSRIGRVHYRGVSDERLDRVLETGIDVVPTSAPFFSALAPSKALEYGGHPKVVIVLHARSLDRTFRELTARASAKRGGNAHEDISHALRSRRRLDNTAIQMPS